uniref:C2H2-type domain-containing protein n=1 Tax=Glossina brevipalpis TaxID=37001 RepID=A0A1A9WWU4_9MUSC
MEKGIGCISIDEDEMKFSQTPLYADAILPDVGINTLEQSTDSSRLIMTKCSKTLQIRVLDNKNRNADTTEVFVNTPAEIRKCQKAPIQQRKHNLKIIQMPHVKFNLAELKTSTNALRCDKEGKSLPSEVIEKNPDAFNKALVIDSTAQKFYLKPKTTQDKNILQIVEIKPHSMPPNNNKVKSTKIVKNQITCTQNKSVKHNASTTTTSLETPKAIVDISRSKTIARDINIAKPIITTLDCLWVKKPKKQVNTAAIVKTSCRTLPGEKVIPVKKFSDLDSLTERHNNVEAINTEENEELQNFFEDPLTCSESLIAEASYQFNKEIPRLSAKSTQTDLSLHNLSGLINYDKMNDEFIMNCFYCSKQFSIYYSVDFEEHVKKEHYIDEIFYNNNELLSDIIMLPIRETNVSIDDSSSNLQEIDDILSDTNIESVNEDVILNETGIEMEYENTETKRIDEQKLLLETSNGNIFPEEHNEDFEGQETILSSVEIEIINANSTEHHELDASDSLDESSFMRKSTAKKIPNKRKLPDNERVATESILSSDEIFPIDVEEDDVPKPTNGNGIIFGVTNRAIVMDFLSLLQDCSALWGSKTAISPDIHGKYIQYICDRLNEKWELKIKIEEIQTTLERIMLWFDRNLKMVQTVDELPLTPTYSEYFEKCLQLPTKNSLLKARVKAYMSWRTILLNKSKELKIKKKRRWNPQECDICGKIEKSAHHLKAHKTYHEPPQIKCTMCPRMFYRKHVMQQHIVSQHLNRLDWICDFCGKQFRTQTRLHIHRKTEHLNMWEVCVVCNYRCSSKTTLMAHQLRRHVPRIGERRKRIESVNRNKVHCREYIEWRKTANRRPDKRFYGCFECKIPFDTCKDLKDHNQKAHPRSEPFTFKCKLCSKSIVCRRNVMPHYRGVHKLPKEDAIRYYQESWKEVEQLLHENTASFTKKPIATLSNAEKTQLACAKLKEDDYINHENGLHSDTCYENALDECVMQTSFEEDEENANKVLFFVEEENESYETLTDLKVEIHLENRI